MMNYFYGYDDTEVNEAKNLIKLLDERIHNVLEKLKTIQSNLGILDNHNLTSITELQLNKIGDVLSLKDNYKLEDLKPLISFGASPRGSINLATAAKCYAFIRRRGYVIPEDVRAVVHDVLRHRIGITYEAEAENITSEDIINKIVNVVEVP